MSESSNSSLYVPGNSPGEFRRRRRRSAVESMSQLLAVNPTPAWSTHGSSSLHIDQLSRFPDLVATLRAEIKLGGVPGGTRIRSGRMATLFRSAQEQPPAYLSDTLQGLLRLATHYIAAESFGIFLVDEQRRLSIVDVNMKDEGVEDDEEGSAFNQKMQIWRSKGSMMQFDIGSQNDEEKSTKVNDDDAAFRREMEVMMSGGSRVSDRLPSEPTNIRLPFHLIERLEENGPIILNTPDDLRCVLPCWSAITNSNSELRNALCAPIFGSSGGDRKEEQDVVALILFGNKSPATFTVDDIHIIEKFTQCISTLFEDNQRREKDSAAFNRSNYFSNLKFDLVLELAQQLFVEDELEDLEKAIIVKAQNLLRADRASFFIVDTEKNQMTSAVFDGQITGQRLVLPLGGIAGWVATTGQPLNLPDVYQDPRFNKEVDLRTGYRTKSMLCMPVLGPSKKIVGVTNLINKKAFESDGKFTVFTREDEELLSAFSLICGLALHKNFLLAEISKKQKTLTLTMEIMSYHAIANAQEVSRYLSTPRLSVPIPDLRSLTFDPHVYSLTDDTLVTIVLDMFKDLGFDMLFGISESMLQPYVLTVRKNYRTNLPYHNFVHATSVTHSIYLMIKTLGVGEIITDPIELFALFVAALNHDVDHRGRSNAFEKNANSVLAAFYSTSTLERHHFHHAMTILQRDEYNLFRNLSPGEYSRALKSFEHAILSTDLAIYFGNLKRLKRLNVEEPFDPSNQEHLELFKGLIMTTSDLIGLTKNFHSSQKTADSVYTEFFLQGDEERRLGMPYSSRLTDRSQESFIPELQVDFLSHVVRPAFEVLRNVIPATGVLLQSVDENIGCWKRWVDAKKPYVIGQPFS